MSDAQSSTEEPRCPIRDDFNPFSPETHRAPIAITASIGREDPVFYNTHSGWWTVAGYDEICEVMRDTKRFSSAASILDAIPTDRSAELAPDGAADDCPALINFDPPGHRRIRRLANQAFLPRVIAGWGPLIEQRVTRLLDGFADQGSCEFVSSFSAPLPIVVISEILGVPEEEEDRVYNWSECLLAVRLPTLTEDELNEQWRYNGEWSAYLEKLVDERRREPKDDLISLLVGATDGDDAKLDNEEVRSIASQLLIAGNETTRHHITALVLRLIEQPELAERVVADDELAEQVVEEELRVNGPARGLFRVAMEDVKLGDAEIRAGDRLQICFSTANQDERMFEDAAEFKLGRPNINRHVAFGRGEHFCIGAPLARLEGKLALQQIAARLPNLRRADDEPLKFQPNIIITGVEELNVEWDVPGK